LECSFDALALIAGPDELSRNVAKVKVLAKREESVVELAQLVPTVKRLLGEP